MPNASGIATVVAMKKETTFGVLAGAAGAKQVRRTKCDISLKKAKYESGEIRTDFQTADARHGVRSVGGSLEGELSPGSYQDPLAAILRKLFAVVAPITGMSITIAGAGPTYTVTRAAGDFLAGGVKVGHVWRFTAGSFNALNLNKNLLVLAATAGSLTVMTLNGTSMFAEGPIAAATLTFPGRQTYTPTTGHTDDSFTIEKWFSDISRSEVYTGCKFTQVDVSLPPTGMSSIKCTVMGKDLGSKGATQYFTSPTAASTSGALAAVNGVLTVAGVAIAILTGINFTISGGFTADPVVGSNTYPSIDRGRVRVNGQMTVKLADATFLDYFDNETEITITGVFTTGSADAAEFVSFTFTRVKVSSNDKDDGEKAVIQTVAFDGLFNSAGGAGVNSEATTLVVQDSLAV